MKGFVVTDLIKHSGGSWVETLFGPAIKHADQINDHLPYSSFNSNDFTPFPLLRFAEEAKQNLQKQESDIVGIAWIEMLIAKTVEEIESFRNLRNFALIWHMDLGPELVGANLYDEHPWVDYPLPGLRMRVNGYRPISSFEQAFFIASERKRQGGGMSGGAKSDFALFSFERLS